MTKPPFPDSSEDLSEGIADPEIENKTPSPLEYAPWHRPRKQYIRAEQWGKQIIRLIKWLELEYPFSEGEPFKYMTLPAPELLDIRLVRDICSERGIPLRYTGFCDSQKGERDMLRRNINQFKYDFDESVTMDSDVAFYRFEEVSTDSSAAYEKMKNGGPFDAINIDACNPLLHEGPNVTGRLIDAVKSTIQYQINARRKPWVLFLTTPMQVDSIATGNKASIHSHIISNSDSNEEFADTLAERMAEGEDLEGFLSRLSLMNGTDFVQIITLGISKWFIHLGEQARIRVKKMDGYCYSMFKRKPFDPNMVSVCYSFEPEATKLSDETGLTKNTVPNDRKTSSENLHVRALGKSFGMKNVDEIMRDEPKLYERMIKETMGLLKTVGYQVDDPQKGYRQWLLTDPHHKLVLQGAGD